MPEKPYKLERIAQGSVPDLGKLLAATFGEFIDNIGPYALTGLAQLCVTIPLVFVALFVIYGGIFGVMALGIVGTALATSAVGDDNAPIVLAGGQLITMGTFVVVLFAGIALITAISAPIQASTVRAVAAQQRGEAKLEFMSMFATMTQDIVPVTMVTVLVLTLTLVGSMLCYVPGLIAMFACVFAASLVALHRIGPVDAIKLAATTAFANPGFHAVYFVLMFAIAFAAANIPVIGPMFLVALQVRACRELYGDGDEPMPPVPA